MYPNNYGQLPAQALLGHTPPVSPLSPRDRCVASGDHLYSAQYTQTQCGLTWASLLTVSSPGQQMVRTQSGAALAIIAGVRSEVKRGQNFHHKKKRHHCYENLRFNTRNVISRSPSQFFYSCVVCCWFRGSFYAFFHTKSLGLFITNQYDRYPFTIARWI